jgi:hypothetical protein
MSSLHLINVILTVNLSQAYAIRLCRMKKLRVALRHIQIMVSGILCDMTAQISPLTIALLRSPADDNSVRTARSLRTVHLGLFFKMPEKGSNGSALRCNV